MMNKLTWAEIMELLQKNEITVGNFVNRYSNSFPAGIGNIKKIQAPEFEDYEEQGRQDIGYYINHFVDHDIFVATAAQVDSYGDNETFPYGYGRQVFPKEKVVTVYE